MPIPLAPDEVARISENDLRRAALAELIYVWKRLYFTVFSMEGDAIFAGTDITNDRWCRMHLPHLALEPSYARVNSDNIMWSREDLLTSINNLRQRVTSGAVVARPEEPAPEPDISRRSKLKF